MNCQSHCITAHLWGDWNEQSVIPAVDNNGLVQLMVTLVYTCTPERTYAAPQKAAIGRHNTATHTATTLSLSLLSRRSHYGRQQQRDAS